MNSPFAVFKLITGETLFVEILNVTDYTYVVRHPRLVKIFGMDGRGQEGFALVPWVPFTDDQIFEIKDNIVYYVGALNEPCIKFYGSILMREEIAKVHSEGKKRMLQGEGTSVIRDVIKEMQEIGEDYSIKYGISPVEDEISMADLSEERTLN